MIKEELELLNYVPDNAKDMACPVFYSMAYLNQLEPKLVSFSAIDRNNKQLLMVIHFQIVERQAISLLHAPFGGLFINHEVQIDSVNTVFKYLIEKFQSSPIDQVVIKWPPTFHKSFLVPTLDVFANSSSFQRAKEINHHLPVTDHKLALRFSDMQRRRLKKCIKANFTVKKENLSELKKVYDFIARCRNEKNQVLSISYQKLVKNIDAMPEAYRIFCCYDQDIITAATICVAVDGHVLYNFLPASTITYNHFSPMVLLIAKVYEYCQQSKFNILDLGTSMLESKVNHNLATFKSGIGGITTERDLFYIHL